MGYLESRTLSFQRFKMLSVRWLQMAYTFFTGNFAAGAPTVFANWSTLPMVCGIMAFVYSGHGVFPAIQAAMKEPKRFPEVSHAAMGTAHRLLTDL